jgi:hypothetical protein
MWLKISGSRITQNYSGWVSNRECIFFCVLSTLSVYKCTIGFFVTDQTPRPSCLLFQVAEQNLEHSKHVCSKLCLMYVWHECRPGLPDFSIKNVPKRREIFQIKSKIPNWYKICLLPVIYTPNGHRIYQLCLC